MREYIYILFIPLTLLMGLSFTACEAQDSPQKEEVQLHVMLDDTKTPTRVNEEGNAFTDGDKFQFFFDSATPSNTSGAKTAEYTYSSVGTGMWTPLPAPIYWDDQTTIPRSFCAFLPYNETGNLNNSTSYSFDVKIDQTTEDNYKASDLLIARVETAKRLIPLKFWHVLSKVVVNVTASTDATFPDSFKANDLKGMVVELINVKPQATITYGALVRDAETKDYDPAITAAATGTATNIKMLCTEAPENDDTNNMIKGTFTAVIPPQDIAVGAKTISFTLTIGETTKIYNFKYTHVIQFIQGKQLAINVNIEKSKVEISGSSEDVKIESWGTVTGEDDDPIKLPKTANYGM